MDQEPLFNKTPQISNEKKTTPFLFLGISLIVVIVLGVLLFASDFLGISRSFLLSKAMIDAKTTELVQKDKSSFYERDFDTVLSNSSELITFATQQNDEFALAHAKTARASALFYTGGEANQKEAVSLIKEVVTDVNIPNASKALAINILTQYYASANNISIFNEIFSGEPFQKLLDDKSKSSSIRHLSDFSRGLFPTALADLQIGGWYAGKLLVPDTLSKETKTEYATQIKTLVLEADTLFASENSFVTSRISDGLFHHYKGFALGALATYDHSFTPQFREAFNKMLDLYANEPSKDTSFLAQIVPYTHFYYAAFLNEISPNEAKNDVQYHLSQIMQMLQNNPQVHALNFSAFVKNFTANDNFTQTDFNSRLFKELGNTYPSFGSFISSQ